MRTRDISKEQFKLFAERPEDYHFDRKRSTIRPQDLQETVVAFANANGGQICIGITDDGRNAGLEEMSSYDSIVKDGILGSIPVIQNISYEFLSYNQLLLIAVYIPKSEKVHSTSKSEVYLRVGACNKKLNQDEISALKYKKGEVKYEEQTKNVDLKALINSRYLNDYIRKQNLSCSPEDYLATNGYIYESKPKIACIVCYHDRPQNILKCGVKINVFEMSKTSRKYIYERTRKKTDKIIFGPIEHLIINGLDYINKVLGEMDISYPREAIIEGFVNALIHRDYSVSEDVIVDIYDNQIVITSPGGFPGTLTDTDLNARKISRFLRNPMINNIVFSISAIEEDFHKRLNQDQGEGIRTIFSVMKKAGLTDPVFKELENRVQLLLRHENAQSYEKKILDYLESHDSIANREARELLGEEDKEKIKNVFKKLENHQKIKRIEKNVPTSKVRYAKFNKLDKKNQDKKIEMIQGKLL